jgi:hypothetical protein
VGCFHSAIPDSSYQIWFLSASAQDIGVCSENQAPYRKSESRAVCVMRRLALIRCFSSFLGMLVFKAAFPVLTRRSFSRNLPLIPTSCRSFHSFFEMLPCEQRSIKFIIMFFLLPPEKKGNLLPMDYHNCNKSKWQYTANHILLLFMPEQG